MWGHLDGLYFSIENRLAYVCGCVSSSGDASNTMVEVLLHVAYLFLRQTEDHAVFSVALPNYNTCSDKIAIRQ